MPDVEHKYRSGCSEAMSCSESEIISVPQTMELAVVTRTLEFPDGLSPQDKRDRIVAALRWRLVAA